MFIKSLAIILSLLLTSVSTKNYVFLAHDAQGRIHLVEPSRLDRLQLIRTLQSPLGARSFNFNETASSVPDEFLIKEPSKNEYEEPPSAGSIGSNPPEEYRPAPYPYGFSNPSISLHLDESKLGSKSEPFSESGKSPAEPQPLQQSWSYGSPPKIEEPIAPPQKHSRLRDQSSKRPSAVYDPQNTPPEAPPPSSWSYNSPPQANQQQTYNQNSGSTAAYGPKIQDSETSFNPVQPLNQSEGKLKVAETITAEQQGGADKQPSKETYQYFIIQLPNKSEDYAKSNQNSVPNVKEVSHAPATDTSTLSKYGKDNERQAHEPLPIEYYNTMSHGPLPLATQIEAGTGGVSLLADPAETIPLSSYEAPPPGTLAGVSKGSPPSHNWSPESVRMETGDVASAGFPPRDKLIEEGYDLQELLNQGGNIATEGAVPYQFNENPWEHVSKMQQRSIKQFNQSSKQVNQSSKQQSHQQANKTSKRVSCDDQNKHCPYWRATGECIDNYNYMLFNCQKSCKLC